jgi:hypothetical protein
MPCRKPAGTGGRPKSAPRRASIWAQRSDTAAIVSDGLTPSEVGMIEESMQ